MDEIPTAWIIYLRRKSDEGLLVSIDDQSVSTFVDGKTILKAVSTGNCTLLIEVNTVMIRVTIKVELSKTH